MNLLVTGGWYESAEHLDEIRNMGYNVFYIARESDELPCDPAEIDGVVCCKVFNWHPIEQFKKLRFIQTESVGYDRVPNEYCKAHGIRVHNVKDTYAGPMSEYIVGHLLAWYQNMAQELQNQTLHGWAKDHSKQELSGKTICIIGTGNIARNTAKRLKAFDCEITAVSHTPRVIEHFDKVMDYDSMEDVLAEADVVIMAAPPTGKAVIGEAELSVMKKTAVLVNVSRGTELDQDALIKALKGKKIQAAILDVMIPEPLDAENELWELDNVIITPHVSYIGEGNADRLWRTIKDTLEEYL